MKVRVPLFGVNLSKISHVTISENLNLFFPFNYHTDRTADYLNDSETKFTDTFKPLTEFVYLFE